MTNAMEGHREFGKEDSLWPWVNKAFRHMHKRVCVSGATEGHYFAELGNQYHKMFLTFCFDKQKNHHLFPWDSEEGKN